MEEQELTQIQMRLKKGSFNDLKIYDAFLGKKVIFEEGNMGYGISIAILTSHGNQFVEFTNYYKSPSSLDNFYGAVQNYKKNFSFNPIIFSNNLPKKVVQKSNIMSITLLNFFLKEENSKNILKFED